MNPNLLAGCDQLILAQQKTQIYFAVSKNKIKKWIHQKIDNLQKSETPAGGAGVSGFIRDYWTDTHLTAVASRLS